MSESKFGVVPKLSLRQKITLFFSGKIFVRSMKPDGFNAFVPVYVVWCCRHGYFLDTWHGFDHHFCCIKCLMETKQKWHV
jgi:hypothetical protein